MSITVASSNGDAPVTKEPEPAIAGSLLAQVREAAQAQVSERQFTLEIGGEFGDHLCAVYRPPNIQDADRYGRLLQNVGPGAQAVEIVADCCLHMVWRQDGQETILEDDHGPVRYGQRLWDLLGWPTREVAPREVVEAIFGHNLRLLDEHVGKLNEWFAQTGEASPGEPSAAHG